MTIVAVTVFENLSILKLLFLFIILTSGL